MNGNNNLYNEYMGASSPFPPNGRWILTATTLASSTAFLLGAAVNIALPTIQTYFNTNITGIEWVANAQLLFLATLLLIGGSLGDIFGRKRIFVLGISLFSAASILAGLSPTIGWLIAFQALQGIASALMVPQSLAIINANFDESQRGRVIGLWAGISGAIAAIGPWLGGWLVQNFTWRAVFFINVPIGIFALVIALMFVPESQKSVNRKLDWSGTLLIFSGLLGISYGLITGQVEGWGQPAVLAGLTGGMIAVAAFVVTDIRKRNALVPVEIFKNPLVTGANAATLTLYFALNGILFFTVLNLQQIQGYSPAEAGLAILPFTALIAIFAGMAGSLSDRIGPRMQMILGPFLVSCGAALLSIFGNGTGYAVHFLPGMFLVGAGMALVIAPLTKSALLAPTWFSGAASGVNNAVARFAALLAIAVLGAVMVLTFTGNLDREMSSSGLSPGQQQQITDQADKLGGVVVPDSFNTSEEAAAQQAVNDSFLYGFRWAMGICAALALAAAVVSFFMIRNPGREEETGRFPPSRE